MKKLFTLLVVMLILMACSSDKSTNEVRLTNGVSFNMPDGYEYFRHKNYPYSAKRGNDMLFLSSMYGEKFDKKVFYTSADTICYNLSRVYMEREEQSKIWPIDKKFVKRYYTFSPNSYAVTYSCHTESKAGFVIAVTYSTADQLQELEEMFDSISIAHKSAFRGLLYTFMNGGWMIYVWLFVLVGIYVLAPKNGILDIVLFFVFVGGITFTFWNLSSSLISAYTIPLFIGGGAIAILWFSVEDLIPERYKSKDSGSNSSSSGDDGGGGDDSSGNEHVYIASDDGSYYNPIDF
jgi:hypothetical protein